MLNVLVVDMRFSDNLRVRMCGQYIQTKTAFSGSLPLSGITDFCTSSLWWNKDLKQVGF